MKGRGHILIRSGLALLDSKGVVVQLQPLIYLAVCYLQRVPDISALECHADGNIHLAGIALVHRCPLSVFH